MARSRTGSLARFEPLLALPAVRGAGHRSAGMPAVRWQISSPERGAEHDGTCDGHHSEFRDSPAAHRRRARTGRCGRSPGGSRSRSAGRCRGRRSCNNPGRAATPRASRQAPARRLRPPTIVVFGINMFGDALRDLLDPRLTGGAGRLGSAKVQKTAKGP